MSARTWSRSTRGPTASRVSRCCSTAPAVRGSASPSGRPRTPCARPRILPPRRAKARRKPDREATRARSTSRWPSTRWPDGAPPQLLAEQLAEEALLLLHGALGLVAAALRLQGAVAAQRAACL